MVELGGWGGLYIAVANSEFADDFFCVKKEFQKKIEANKTFPGLQEKINPLPSNQIM